MIKEIMRNTDTPNYTGSANPNTNCLFAHVHVVAKRVRDKAKAGFNRGFNRQPIMHQYKFERTDRPRQ